MPTTRTPIKRGLSRRRLTPQVIAAYTRARALYNKSERWEEEGGRRREYFNACSELQALLGLTACDVQVLDTVGDDTGTSYDGWGTVDEWLAAINLRLELERLTQS